MPQEPESNSPDQVVANDPGVSSTPPASGDKPKRGRKPKPSDQPAQLPGQLTKNVTPPASGDEKISAPQPWANFNEVPDTSANRLVMPQMDQRAAAELVPLPGYVRYMCIANCGNGRYVKGRAYPLPDGQDKNFFTRLG